MNKSFSHVHLHNLPVFYFSKINYKNIIVLLRLQPLRRTVIKKLQNLLRFSILPICYNWLLTSLTWAMNIRMLFLQCLSFLILMNLKLKIHFYPLITMVTLFKSLKVIWVYLYLPRTGHLVQSGICRMFFKWLTQCYE